MYKFVDLFCGIGGFRVALEKQGLECVFSSDIDQHARESYYQNFGEKPVGDISEVPGKKIPKHDVLCAGFPCQPFSTAGKKRGMQDDRGSLFYEIIRIAQYHQPYVLLLENVRNIMTIDGGNAIKTIEKRLNEIGYDVYKHVLNASNFGIPQKRERVYFVCLRRDMDTGGNPLKCNRPKENFIKIYLDSILQKEVEKSLYIDRNDIIMRDNIVTENQLKPIQVGIFGKGRQGERIYSTKGHAITLLASTNRGLYLDDKGIRRLSITECKRVMGFKDSHIVSNGAQGYKQLGNAVIPSMIEYVWCNTVYY